MRSMTGEGGRRFGNALIRRAPRATFSRQRGRRTHTSNLLEFDQRSVEILRMQEQYGLPVRSDLGLAVAQHARAACFQLVASREDVVHLVADMVHAPVGVLLEEF